MKSLKLVSFLGAFALASLAAGCGAGAPPEPKSKTADTPTKRGVFTSASDCAAFGPALADCTKAIEAAVTRHEAKSKNYATVASCEKSEGVDKCERTADRRYRPRLIAFVVTMGPVPVAEPLYPTKKDETGFRTVGDSVLKADDETITFSRDAIAAAEQWTTGKKRRRS